MKAELLKNLVFVFLTLDTIGWIFALEPYFNLKPYRSFTILTRISTYISNIWNLLIFPIEFGQL